MSRAPWNKFSGWFLAGFLNITVVGFSNSINRETTGLDAGTYYVRRKAEESYHASEYTMVIVPEYSPTPEELANDAIAAANALLPTEVLVVDEAKDTNILEKFNAIPGMSETGVILTLGNVVAGGENPNIDQNGNITYSPGASYGDVKVMINRMHGAQQTCIITVYVPPHNPGVVEGANSDITAALGYLSNMPTLVEGTHTNLIYVLDSIPGMPSIGVTLTLDATGHPNIADDGTITYGDTTKTAVVIVRVSKGPGETKEYNLYVTVPAHIKTKADVANDAIETARALLLDYQSQLNLVEGRDTNLLTVLNAIPGMSETGVILTVGGSSNPNIAKDGTITYGAGEASGYVGVKMNKVHGTEQEEMIMTIVRKDNILLYSGLTKSGDMITGGLTLQIVNDNPQLENCDMMIAVYEKGGNKLAALKKVKVSLNLGANVIELNDLSFFVDPAITYEVRIFSWTQLSSLLPVTDVFRADT